jgi:hypothetical protein
MLNTEALSVVNARLIQLQSDRQDYQDELLEKQAAAIHKLQTQSDVSHLIYDAVGLKRPERRASDNETISRTDLLD